MAFTPLCQQKMTSTYIDILLRPSETQKLGFEAAVAEGAAICMNDIIPFYGDAMPCWGASRPTRMILRVAKGPVA